MPSEPQGLDYFIAKNKLEELSIGQGNNHWKKVCKVLHQNYTELNMDKGLFTRLGSLLNSLSDLREKEPLVAETQHETFKLILSLRQTPVSRFISETSNFLFSDLFSTKRLNLLEYTNEVIGWTFLLSFGEFWEIALQIHTGTNVEGEKLFDLGGVLSDGEIQGYLLGILSDFENNCIRAIGSVLDTEMLLNTYELVQNMIKLPLLSQDEDFICGKEISESVMLIRLFLDIKSEKIQDLFKHEDFCLFFSIYKKFLEEILRNIKTHFVRCAERAQVQIIDTYDVKQFKASDHPVAFPSILNKESRSKSQINSNNEPNSEAKNTYFKLTNIVIYL